MRCDECRAELSAYVDDQLEAPQKAALAAHLAGCVACREEEQRTAKVWEVLGELPVIQPSAEFRARFWERVREEEMQPAGRPFWRLLPRLVPVFVGATTLWVLGVRGGIELHERRHAGPSAKAVELFTEPYASNSLERLYLDASPALISGRRKQ